LEQLIGAHGDELRETSRTLEPDELELATVIGSPTRAERAPAASRERARRDGRPVPPAGGVDSLPDAGHDSGDLVTEHGAGLCELRSEVEVAPADPAPGDTKEHLPGLRDRRGHIGKLEPGVVLGQDDRLHVVSPR